MSLLLPAAVAAPGSASAVEGKWTPEQLLEHDPAWLEALGLEIPASELWDPDAGGLLEATVKIGGCTAGFVSPEGLLVTNHHCVFSVLQEHSSAERDLTTHGFLAAGRDEELPAGGVRVRIPHRFTDVTAEVLAAVPDDADDLERYRAIDRRKKALVASCEEQAHRRCQVAVYDDGVAYRLLEFLEFPDVRLVFAPPLEVGGFGGEIDNWSWPRHSGDVALARVYADADGKPAPHAADNVPYRPRRYLRIAPEGVDAGDFVLLAGYPGRTYRSLIAPEIRRYAERFFADRSRLLRAWIDVMEAAGEADDDARILLSDRIKRNANREKNARGQIAGIERGDLVAKKERFEAEVLAWAEAHRPAAAAAYRELAERVAAQGKTWERDHLLAHLGSGPVALELALVLTRWAMEREKPDAERDPEYQERKRDELLEDQVRQQKRLHPPTEQRLLADFLARMAAVPENQRMAAVEDVVGDAREVEAIAPRVAKLFRGSKILDLEARREMFEASVEELVAREDPMLDLALAMNREIVAIEEEKHRFEGAVSRLRPAWRQAVEAYLGRPLDADANGTLRVSLAEVKGYRPRDGIWMEPRTRLAGVVEKQTGESPFDAPEAILEAAKTAAESRWADPELGDVPVGFLATGDTTGGNSGSPVLDGRGRLVGVNFDRVWENVANDFGYNPEIARNVSVDVRYMLWVLETLHREKARVLFDELGVSKK